MKKIFTLALFSFLIITCKKESYQTEAGYHKTLDPVITISDIQSEDEKERMEIKSYGVVVGYPVFYNIKNSDAINDIIFDSVTDINDHWEDIENSPVQTTITRNDETYISLVFDGLEYNGISAYPTRMFYTLLVDKNKGVRLKLSDIVDVDIDEEFASRFRNNANFVLQDMGAENYDIQDFYSKGLVIALKNADTRISIDDPEIPSGYFDPSIRTYLTEKNLMLRTVVIHLLGDFIDVPMPLSFLKTDWQND